MIEFFSTNYEWMFSGVFSGFIFWFLGQRNGFKKAIKQKQKIGKNSKGIQVGGDYSS
ncbi:hypothetical protein [Cyclobacterium marinum]|nr:hypothetical protein [Cyclobacterium marinum]|tara:strand:- start:3022 stop:3192 length:171 start_codon:yes stop_codon:yes gene_type:complete